MALKASVLAAQDQVNAAAKDYAATRADLKDRTEKLQSLTELLSVLKKSVESNDEELVEVKQQLKQLQPKAPSAASLTDGDWWDQLVAWKYMPALAVGLSAVAVGFSVAHK
jgi:septal ring factor EnvC (AmiA/AmiB activator)